ncbi:hypothetical protein BB560_003509 [Smittium megazygosporum]|uniref:Uncharacterized protein n=1 Tax=Smittium megazygosporum TaxID=133381 RepID=A0A2T9ZBY5_9FUNG|nr:hypothetical protein BB560_003509 [Smittium megazygosporum]
MSEDRIPQAGSTEFSAQRTELRLPDTMKFDGNPKKFKEFMARMSLHFWAKPETFKLIMGNSQQLGNFDAFMHLFAENFSDPTFAVQARSKLEKCRQFGRSITIETNFNQTALKFFYSKCLCRPYCLDFFSFLVLLRN